MLPYAPWLCWILPLIGALLTPIFASIHHKLRDYMPSIFVAGSALLSASMIPDILAERATDWSTGAVLAKYLPFDWQVPWIPQLNLNAGVLVDPLSVFMANIVSWLSLLIVVYSLGYMHGDRSLTRYYFLVQFFIGSMLLLVMSDNLFQLLFGWEGVGVCSYQLIGFWYENEEKNWVAGETWMKGYPPSHAGMKAFIATRAGDVGLILASVFLYLNAHTLNFVELERNSEWVGVLARGGMLLPVAVMLFLGPMGKSAQFPLMEWLPEAMTGPTTVSALIHAATMVKAGVYLVARILPIFHHALWIEHFYELSSFFTLVATIGAMTAFIAATQALVQREIKKVLAYSTLSQLGYMMLGLGVGGLAVESAAGYFAGAFHLMTHAVFKALLFLSAGAILHATETKDMFQMGGLKDAMPITYRCMLVGALALSGIPPLSGFWSKESIFGAIWELGHEAPTHGVPMFLVFGLFTLAALTAAMTLFYSLRMIGVTFLRPKSQHLKELEHHGHHVHEAPPVMWVPLAILATATILLGVLGPITEIGLKEFFAGLLHAEDHYSAIGILKEAFTSLTFAITIGMLALGGIPGFFLYVRPRLDIAAVVERSAALKSLQTFLYNRYYINALYYKLFVHGIVRFSQMSYERFERGMVDRFNYAVADAAKAFSTFLNRFVELGLIDRFNYLVANVTRATSEIMFRYPELRGIDRLNYLIADGAVAVSSRFRKTHTGVLSYNMMLVLLTLVFMILALSYTWFMIR